MFPHRDDVVAHLDRHAHEDGIELLLGTEVHRIDRRAPGWRLQTSAGDIDARQVVVANGNEHTPRIPEFPGAVGSTIEMLHSSAYRNPSPYADKRVLVVGSGSSGMEIAHDLATGGAAKVWLAVRTPPHILLRSLPGGLPSDLISLPLYHSPVRIADAVSRAARKANLGDLSEFGLPMPADGVFTSVKRFGKRTRLGRYGRRRRHQGWTDRGGPDGRSPSTGTRSSSWTDRGWTRTPPFWPPASFVDSNRWSVTSACSTRTANRSSSGKARAAEGLRFLGYRSGRRSSASTRNVPAHGEANRPGTVSRLDTPTPAPGRESASGTRRGSCARRCSTACPAARACTRGTSGAPGMRTLSATAMDPVCSQPRPRMLCRSGR